MNESRRCSKGHENPPGQNFCGDCGEALSTGNCDVICAEGSVIP
jgi:hypothetical protein